jgi:dolichol-phosphate hexosyltransferase
MSLTSINRLEFLNNPSHTIIPPCEVMTMNSNEYQSQINNVQLNDFSYNYIDKNDVTIVIPTLNEEKGIELVLKDVLLAEYPHVIVIDGNSIDDTVKIVKNFNVALYPQSGKGKTGAIKTALSYIKTPCFVVIDGDYTYSVKDIDSLLDKAIFNNQVIGARRDRNNIKLLNRFGNNVINMLFNLFYSTRLTDVCSGLYILKTSFAKNLVLETGGFDVEVEIAAQAAESNKIEEIPISYGSRVGTQKLNPFRDGFRIISSIFKLSRNYSPLIFYMCLISALCFFLGVGLLILDILSLVNGVSSPIINIIIPMSIGFGIQILMLTIITSQLKYMMNRYYQKNQKSF